jgi:hypothetical protein
VNVKKKNNNEMQIQRSPLIMIHRKEEVNKREREKQKDWQEKQRDRETSRERDFENYAIYYV